MSVYFIPGTCQQGGTCKDEAGVRVSVRALHQKRGGDRGYVSCSLNSLKGDI